MHNKVVFRSAKALQEAGFETMRFNFRGVGQSTGEFDEGQGEFEDAKIALDYLLESQRHAREVVVAGFSFGSIIGLRLGCADDRVNKLISIGTPARSGNLDFIRDCNKPKLFVHGSEDELAPIGPLEEFLTTLPATANYRFVRIDGAGHFFDDHGAELMSEIKRFVAE